MNRNAPCPCGSGRRFKHCCGKEPVSAPAQPRDLALAAQRAGSLGQAEALYRRALAEHPDDVDSLHMLGIVQFERMRYREALSLLWDAAERTSWSVPAIRHNVGLVLGKLLTREANLRQADLLATFVAREHAPHATSAETAPLVSVVLPAYNHARYVAEALASVAAQTYANLELVVIDDGSTDATAAVVSGCLASFARPVRFVSRENRGAPATLNEGAALARGQYVAFLNSDDRYAPERIATLVEAIARNARPWGFSLVSNLFGEAESALADGTLDVLQKQRNFLGTQPPSFTLVEFNVAVSSGNLFVERDFFLSLGGFRDYRYNHDWDFCLRAASVAEPVVVERPLYFYRVHAANTIAESRVDVTRDADRVFGDFLAHALADEPGGRNDLGPCWRANRTLLLRQLLRGGQGALVPPTLLRALADAWRTASPAPRGDAAPSPRATPGARRTALVVLGMHRSGTSALARVLNLCGAFLPAKLKPAKLGVNPKGFWEPEAVLDLNVRAMRQLGGDWCNVDFAVPDAGELVDEFVADACALIGAEYEGRDLIAIKDPRICILAPLWHRALEAAGYRPAYVVPVRNPLEVAQSLHARGDMSIDAGLELWRDYMARVTAFAETRSDVVFVRYTELLDDWRGVVERVARRLDVPLDVGGKDEAVQRFLDKGLRNQAAGDDALDSRVSGASGEAIRALYRASLARCADAPASASPIAPVPVPARSADEHRETANDATACFVLCIENNGIRDQALLLCRSIRRFAGRYRDAPILAYAPRPGLGVDAATRRQLEALDVEYVDAPLNATCREYPPANRVFAGAHAETHSDADFLVVCDSDTVWLDEPELPVHADAAVRPVDSKGSATRGPGDRFEAYWARLAELGGTSLERLPFLRSTIGNERIRASYNAGFTIARRRLGMLTRCADIFAASVGAHMRPYAGTGMEIVASTGAVGRDGSEYWGSSQAALTLAIWATTDRVVHYPDCYNVPLHLVASEGEIDPRWLARPPVHLHYHWMFDERHHENAMELLARLRVPADRRAWLLERTPYRSETDGRCDPVSFPGERESRERTDPSTTAASS
jgi:glycosyltransferase involved in cell wall biosynthesis